MTEFKHIYVNIIHLTVHTCIIAIATTTTRTARPSGATGHATRGAV